MGMVALDDVLQPQGGAELSTSAGQAVLLEADGVVVRGLNPTAASVWTLLDGQRSVGDIAAVLAQRHGVDPAVLEADVVLFLSELERLGLVAHTN